MNVLLYVRVSSASQAEKGLSIPSQLRSLERHCEDGGHRILKRFPDEGYSGTTDKRPGLQEMMRYCKVHASEIDAILVWKFNRFFRNRVDSAVYKRHLRSMGIEVISITQPIATESIDSDLMEAVVEAADGRFSKSLAQDVMRGMAEVARRGFFPFSMPPYGYNKRPVADGKASRYTLVPNEHSSTVKKIFSLYVSDGLGAKGIAKTLNVEGLRTHTGKPFTAKFILRVLANQVYVGTVSMQFKTENAIYLPERDRQVLIKNSHEPIVSLRTFQQAQRIRRKRAKEHPRTLGSEYLLSGLLRCGKCGKTLVGASARSGKNHYYGCQTYFQLGKEGCDLGLINRDLLDGIVIEKTRDVLLEPKQLEELAEQVNGELGDTETLRKQERAALDIQIRKKKQLIEALIDAVEQRSMSFEVIRERLQTRQGELQLLEARRRELEVDGQTTRVAKVDLERVLPYVECLKETLSNAAIKTRRFILKSFIKEITVRRDHITIEFSIPEEETSPQSLKEEVLGTGTSSTP